MKPLLRGMVFGATAALLVAVIFCVAAFAHDEGQWENSNPGVTHWFQTLMMPDNPQVSCCGEADAYWADDIHVRDGKTYATITDDRDDKPLRRPHVDVGTVIEVPDAKLKYDSGNPTGHAVVFLSVGGIVYCFVQGSGI